MKISVVSGGFDPIHTGHLSYLKEARRFGEKLIVCLNSDHWLTSKKGQPFLPFHERKSILESLKYVDKVIEFDDSDGSCISALNQIKKRYPRSNITFCNGGDRTEANIPELSVPGINFKFEVGGGDKKNSSSQILESWSVNNENRRWGFFNTILTKKDLKIKELNVKPRQGMSFQMHLHRSEVWFIYKGSCKIFIQLENDKTVSCHTLNKGDIYKVPSKAKHQIINPNNELCSIIEIQYGSKVDEKDIQRFFFYPETP